MKYRLQDGFDKIHRCVIVVINDDVPHAWTFYLYLVLLEEIEFRFIEGFEWVWILVLGERAAEYFCHLIPIHPLFGILKLLPRVLACSIAAPIRVPFPSRRCASLIWVRPRPDHMLSERGDFRRLLRIRHAAPLRWLRFAG